MPKSVFILGSPEDEHAACVAERVAARGLHVGWLNGNQFPAAWNIAFEPSGGGHVVTSDGQKNDFDQIESVYWRTYLPPVYPNLPNAEQADLAYTDSRCLFDALLIELPTRWVNGWAGFQTHQCKPAALARVERLALGPRLRIPKTLHTNDPAALTRFVEEVGDCIFKPVHGGAHTRRVSKVHLSPEHLELLQHAPVTIQQEAPGVDVRVFIAGQRVLACELQTEALDFRDDEDPRIVATDLPDDVIDDCRKIAAALDLVWTGIDLRRTNDDEFYFFEANPSPMFLGFESRCGLPLTESLVDLLVGKQ